MSVHLTKINTRIGENKTSKMNYFAKMSIHPDWAIGALVSDFEYCKIFLISVIFNALQAHYY